MVIVLQAEISRQQRQALEAFLHRRGLGVQEIVGSEQCILGIIGKVRVCAEELAALAGVQEVIPIAKPYKRASREWQQADSIYHLNSVGGKRRKTGIRLGAQRLLLCAELPLAEEPEGRGAEQPPEEYWQQALLPSLLALREAGVSLLSYSPPSLWPSAGELSGGAPGSAAWSRAGQRELDGLRWRLQAVKEAGLPLLSTVSGLRLLQDLAPVCDLLRVPPQQMRNIELLAELAQCGKPLILERAADATLEEFLLTAEFLLNCGASELILAEGYVPNPSRPQSPMLDFANIQLLQGLSHLPVFVNLQPPQSLQPAGGLRHEHHLSSQLTSAALAALAVGAQGICFAVRGATGSRPGNPLVAEWPEAIYMLEQVAQMSAFLQREIVRWPQAASATQQRAASGSSAGALVLQVAFQGEPGAYSEQALRQFFAPATGLAPVGDGTEAFESLPCPDFRRLFEAVQSGRADFAVVPLENSLAGSIVENYDLLLEYADLCICAETRLRVSHALIATAGTKLEQLRRVRSHPQALAQCSQFLQQHDLQPVANFDTAGSVRELQNQPQKDVAAIASVLAAQIYDMQILDRAIENNPHNYTRFAIVCRSDSACRTLLGNQQNLAAAQSKNKRKKWSLCLRLRNFSGSLAAALQIFQKYQLDLTKLESRPIMGQPWSYRFYLDTLISKELTPTREAAFFGELERVSQECRIIGRYWENRQ